MKTIVRNGKTATLRKARKQHRCSECPFPIFLGERYFEVVLNGSGLGSSKFPDRVHARCLRTHWEKNNDTAKP